MRVSAHSILDGIPRPSDAGEGGQLRLVLAPEAHADPSSRLDHPTDASVIAETGAERSRSGTRSLAVYALGLSAGDACFCCGAELTPLGRMTGSEGSSRAPVTRTLECRRCGARVTGP